MSIDIWTQAHPRLVMNNFKEIYDSPCKAQSSDDFPWYKGTGISPADHPLKWYIPLQDASCGVCESKDVLIIAAQWNVSFANGDKYWDYEVECQECHQFTTRAYAD